jgi:hypothetical protein
VVVIACANLEVSLRVKRVVDCIVETDQVIEQYPAAYCPTEPPYWTANQLIGQWFGYDGCLFGDESGLNGIPGVPIITKVKNFKRRAYLDSGGGPGGEYTGDIYTADVQIRFCTNCSVELPAP